MTDETVQRIQTIRRLVRWFVTVGVILGVGYLLWKYDVEQIPGEYGHLGPQKMKPGTSVVSTALRESTPLGLGSVIRYAPPSGGGRQTYGVIAGVPGEEIRFDANAGGLATFFVGERRERILLPNSHLIPDGKIPEGHYLVLLGDRHQQPRGQAPDSRRLGLISRDWIQAKIISSLFFL